jgi:hypothetical protein
VAYFICESPKHVVCRPGRALFDPETGRRSGSEREIFVEFRRYEAPLWARQVAAEVFEFKGYPQGIDPLEWLAFVDTEMEQEHHNWTEEEYQVVDERLRNMDGVVEVFVPEPVPPWPNYESLSAEKNLEVATITGFPIEDLISFEQSSRGDEKVLARYMQVLADLAEVETIVSA